MQTEALTSKQHRKIHRHTYCVVVMVGMWVMVERQAENRNMKIQKPQRE